MERLSLTCQTAGRIAAGRNRPAKVTLSLLDGAADMLERLDVQALT